MNLGWIRPLAMKMRGVVVKNAPHILMGMGTGSAVTAVIFAVQATPKAHEALTEAAEKADRKLTLTDKVKTAGKYYIPAAGMETFSLLCFWGAHGIDMRRQALLAGLCSTAEQALIEYQKKVTEMIGEKGEKEIRKSIGQDFVDRNPPTTVVVPGDTDLWCLYDNQYFKSNYLKLKGVENDANHEMIQHMYISKSELMWLMDPDRKWLKPSDSDALVGWNVDNMISLDITSALGPEHQPVLLVTVMDKDGMEYPPEAGFSSLC